MKPLSTLIRLACWASAALLSQGAAAESAVSADATPVRVLLAPALETTLVSQMSGRIVEVNAVLGRAFTKGQVLIRFDCSEQQARVAMSEAERASAEQELEVKLRLQGLQQATEVEVGLAASLVEKTRAQVRMVKAQLAWCSVVAPFTGRTAKVLVRPFQGVAANQPLLEAVSDGPLKLRLNMPGVWLRWLKIGTAFSVAIDETGKTYEARVTAINARVDAVSQTVELEATLATRAPELLPGMSGNARFNPP
ncbi:MAG: HlyD family efflux transporter periplasmic adaptor subunit [Azonexus sp.]|jgi:RND family efflux transporter MFP subunit|nr:HlyD family efflux transporter periplasmic adaptor subunit [Azonexus sp.]